MLIACQRTDGGVSILHMVEGADVAVEVEKLSQTLGDVNIVSYREITVDQVPTDRRWRNAWTDEYPTPTVDIHFEKAKEITINAYRALRDDAFKKLDAEYARYTSNPEKQQEVEAERQRLRDIPQKLEETLSALDDLDSAWPHDANALNP